MARRFVKSFDDVNSALRELYDQYDYLRTKNIDLNKRRIINAHPSIDDYDYVVRKELHDLVGGGQTAVQRKKASNALTYDKITFGLGIGRSIAVGDNVTPPYIWTNAANGRADIIAVAANIPPVGSDLLIDIRRNGASILTLGQFALPSGTGVRTVIHGSGVFISGLFKRYDVFSAHVLQVGSSTPGREVEVVVYCNLV